jgi:hypothetical protein
MSLTPARGISPKKDCPVFHGYGLGIFREMPQYRETLEEIVKSGRLTKHQDHPPDANKRELALIRISSNITVHDSRLKFTCRSALCDGVAKRSQCNPTLGSKDSDSQHPRRL